MTTQQRIDKITEDLRDLYNNANEGPRLIAEMVEREFPTSLNLASTEFIQHIESLEGELAQVKAELDDEEE